MSIFKNLLCPGAFALAFLGGCTAAPYNSADSSVITAPAATPVAKNDQGQDVECDTEMETGSHVHKHTVCMSQQDRDAQEQAMSALRSHGNGSLSH